MTVDERSKAWNKATKSGHTARLDGEPMSSNPYHLYGDNGEAALFICWQRGWMEADRELTARGNRAAESMGHDTFQRLVVL